MLCASGSLSHRYPNPLNQQLSCKSVTREKKKKENTHTHTTPPRLLGVISLCRVWASGVDEEFLRSCDMCDRLSTGAICGCHYFCFSLILWQFSVTFMQVLFLVHIFAHFPYWFLWFMVMIFFSSFFDLCLLQ